MADSGNNRVVKISQDSDDIISIPNIGYCTALAVNSENRNCFMAAPELNQILEVDALGSFKNHFVSIEKPINLFVFKE